MGKQKSKLPGATQQHIRMNFLAQAAGLMAMLSDPVPTQQQQQQQQQQRLHSQQKRLHRRSFRKDEVFQEDHEGLHPLSRYYNTTMKKIGQRMVLRLDPHLKRTICKRCNTSLIPAVTSTIRIQSRPETTTVTRCNICGEEKRLVAHPQYQLFNDRPDIHFNRSESDDDNNNDDNDDTRYQDKKITSLNVDKSEGQPTNNTSTTTTNTDENAMDGNYS